MNTEIGLCLFLAVCALSDWKTRKVPRHLTLLGLLWMIWKAGTGAAWGVGAGLVCYPLFLLRMVGAADVKLVAVIVGLLGIRTGSASVMTGLALGAVWSAGKLLRKGLWRQRLSWLAAYFRASLASGQWKPYYVPERDGRQVVIPFVCCLFLGTVICLGWKSAQEGLWR